MNSTDLAWPLSRLDEALIRLAQMTKLIEKSSTFTSDIYSNNSTREADLWVQQTAVSFGFEAEPITIRYPDLTSFLQTASPAVFQLAGETTPHFLILLVYKRGQLTLLRPDLKKQRLSLQQVQGILCSHFETPLLPEIDQLLSTTGVSNRRKYKARTVLLNEHLKMTQIEGCWQLKASPGSDFKRQLKQAKLPQKLLIFLLTYAIQYGLLLLSWWIIGRSILQRNGDLANFYTWALLILTLIPLRLLITWLQGTIAITVGFLLQKRLLFGVLRLPPNDLRHMGAGQLMGRVFDSESFEMLTINGGLSSLIAIIELLFAVWILSLGAIGILHVSTLLVWMVLLGWIAINFYHSYFNWAIIRRELTHDLIEKMVGNRTRIVQQTPVNWHDGEEKALFSYVNSSIEMDKLKAQFTTFAIQGWLIIGLLELAPAFLSNQMDVAELLVSIGGIMSAVFALRRLAQGLNYLIGATVSWQQIALFFKAGTLAKKGISQPIPSMVNPEENIPFVCMDELMYRYTHSHKPVLTRCNLQVNIGDHILIEGESGSGKSTLISLLTGLDHVSDGSLLINGVEPCNLDRLARHQLVAVAPQFHENYLLGSTLLFNLSMARNWPPQKGENALAKSLCEDLGLGELLEKMPSGISQTVGETGWQLSHGERTRLYIGRALFQEADLVILDESFSSLDPENLQKVMSCVKKRATTLIVIAHP